MSLLKLHKGKLICRIIYNVDGRYLFDDRYECRDFCTMQEAVDYARATGYEFKLD